MTDQATPKLRVGGTLGLGDLYVRRAEDDTVFEALADCEFCNILTSRQMGKSSLMVRLMTQLKAVRDARIASIDMAGDLGTPALFAAGATSPDDNWYIGFLEKVALDLGLDCDAEGWWTTEGRGTANQRLLQFFRTVVGAKLLGPVFIFVDEVDASLKLPCSDDFFTAVRSIYNQRATVAEYRRITFCLVGVASPGELIKDRRTTPYNVGRTIELRDFDPDLDDLSPLYDAMSDDGAPGRDLVHAVLRQSGGQPFLTVALCSRAMASGVRTPAEIDAMIGAAIQARTHDEITSHLESINAFLATRLHDEGATFQLYSAILRGHEVRERVTAAHRDLRLSGLVKRGKDGFLIVRNRVYEQRFGRAWLSRRLDR